jgi:hypothetical protein
VKQHKRWFFQCSIWLNLESLKSIAIGLGLLQCARSGNLGRATFKYRRRAHTWATRGKGTRRVPPIHQSGSMLASVADPKGLPQPSLSPPHIRGGSGRKYLPLSLSLLHTEVSTIARSSPASCCATRPFANSFGRPNPRTVALLLPLPTPVSSRSCASHHQWGVT